MRKYLLGSILLLSLQAHAGTSTADWYGKLGPGQTIQVGGSRHIALLQAFEAGVPGFGGSQGADVRALVPTTDYTIVAGVLTVPPGHAPMWLRLRWTYDDTPDPNDVLSQQAADQATTELEAERPRWQTLVQDALTKLAQGETQRSSDETAVATDRTALAAATTLAQAKPIIDRMLVREDRALNREEQLYIWLERIVRAIAGLLRVPMPQGGGAGGGIRVVQPTATSVPTATPTPEKDKDKDGPAKREDR